VLKRDVKLQLTNVSKLKDFWRSQAVTYAVKVEVSQKRCKVKTMLIQTS